MEIGWGAKPNYISYGCPMANWKGHETHNPNHMNESLLSEVDWGAHDSSVFLFLVNIDYDAKPNESPIQGLWVLEDVVATRWYVRMFWRH